MFSVLRGGMYMTSNKLLAKELDKINKSLPKPTRMSYLLDALDALLVIFLTRPNITYFSHKLLRLFGINYEEYIKRNYYAYPSKTRKEIFEQTLSKIRYQNQVPAAFLLEQRLQNLNDEHATIKNNNSGLFSTNIITTSPFFNPTSLSK